MKKLIAFLIGLILIGIVIAQPPVPAPVKIFVKLNGASINFDATATNLDSGEILTKKEVPSLAIKDGIGMFDYSDFKEELYAKSRNSNGDQIEVKVCDFAPECTYIYHLETIGMKTIEINILDTNKFVCWNGNVVDNQDDCPSQQIEEFYICWDGSKVIHPSGCPKQPEQPQKYICSDGSEVDSQEDCPVIEEKDYALEIILGILSGLIAIAIVILAKLKWGKGFVGLTNYYKKKGDEAKAKGEYEKAAKYYGRAAKMVGTAIKKAKENKYK
jgi:hypothetical protein